jgi:DNA-binding cell septation regulator SpoVG
VILNGEMQLTGLKVMDGVNGLFVAYPNDPGYKGDDFRSIFYPLTRELREHIEETVLIQYRNSFDARSKVPKEAPKKRGRPTPMIQVTRAMTFAPSSTLSPGSCGSTLKRLCSSNTVTLLMQGARCPRRLPRSVVVLSKKR